MVAIYNVDEHTSDKQWARGQLTGGNLPIVITGESRSSLYTHLHKMMQQCNGWTVREHESLYVYYGRFWRSFMRDDHALASKEITEMVKDSMSGPLTPTLAKTFSRKRRFIYLGKKPIPSPLFKLEDRVRQTLHIHQGPGEERHIALYRVLDSVRDSKK